MSEQYTVYTVGDVVCPPSNDETKFDIADDGAVLLYKFRNPSAAEKKQFKNGAFCAEVIDVDGIIFVCTRFGTLSWTDAPFNASVMRASMLPIPKKGQGLGVHCALINADDGKLIAQRLIGLNTELSIKLLDLAIKQPQMSDFDERLSAIYSKYTTLDLVEMAKAKK